MKMGMELAVHGWSSSHPTWFLPAKRGNSLLGLPKQWVARCCKGSACTPKCLPHFLPNTFYVLLFILTRQLQNTQLEDGKTSPSTEQRAITTRPFSPIIMEVEKYLKTRGNYYWRYTQPWLWEEGYTTQQKRSKTMGGKFSTPLLSGSDLKGGIWVFIVGGRVLLAVESQPWGEISDVSSCWSSQASGCLSAWKAHISSENWWLEDEFPVWMAYFQGRAVSFRESKLDVHLTRK